MTRPARAAALTARPRRGASSAFASAAGAAARRSPPPRRCCRRAGSVLTGVSAGIGRRPSSRGRQASRGLRRVRDLGPVDPLRLQRRRGRARDADAPHLDSMGYGAPQKITPLGIAQGAGDAYLLCLSGADRATTAGRSTSACCRRWTRPTTPTAASTRTGPRAARSTRRARSSPPGGGRSSCCAAAASARSTRSSRRSGSRRCTAVASRAHARRHAGVVRLDAPGRPARRTSPANSPAAYYPGDRYVDWVGTDFYSKFPNFQGLEAFYGAYPNKPFAFGEWAIWGGDNPSLRGPALRVGRAAIARGDDALQPGLRDQRPLPAESRPAVDPRDPSTAGRAAVPRRAGRLSGRRGRRLRRARRGVGCVRVTFVDVAAGRDRSVRRRRHGHRDRQAGLRRPVFHSIVVGTDGSQTADEAVRQAAELAAADRCAGPPRVRLRDRDGRGRRG